MEDSKFTHKLYVHFVGSSNVSLDFNITPKHLEQFINMMATGQGVYIVPDPHSMTAINVKNVSFINY